MHYLCRFYRREDSRNPREGIYYSARLGNSRLLLFPADDGNLSFYLGGQLEPEKKSRQIQFRGTNSARACTDDHGKMK